MNTGKHEMFLLQDVIDAGNSALAERFVDLLLPSLLDNLHFLDQKVDDLLAKKKCERMIKAIDILINILDVNYVCYMFTMKPQ